MGAGVGASAYTCARAGVGIEDALAREQSPRASQNLQVMGLGIDGGYVDCFHHVYRW